jgi:hypothetical protein
MVLIIVLIYNKSNTPIITVFLLSSKFTFEKAKFFTFGVKKSKVKNFA